MATTQEVREYIGFYLVEGMWAGLKPDYSKFNDAYWLTPEYTKLMDEVVLSVERNGRAVIVCRDGLVGYRDSGIGQAIGTSNNSFVRIENYTEIINALYLLLISTVTQELKIKYHTYFEITHHDLVPLRYEGDKWMGAGIPTKSLASYQINKRFLSYVPHNLTNSLDLYVDMPPRPIVSEEILNRAITSFLEVVKDRSAVKLLGRTNKALAEYASMSFSNCLLIAWLQVETYLYELLEAFMAQEGSARFNSERRGRLLHESTISEVTEVLEAARVIDQDLYKLLNQVRRVRNKVVHENHSANRDEAAKAIKLTEKIIVAKTGQPIKLDGGLQWMGF